MLSTKILTMDIAGGTVRVGDYVRITHRSIDRGPLIGDIVPIVYLRGDDGVYVQWGDSPTGMYGKFACNVEKFDPDVAMDDGL